MSIRESAQPPAFVLDPFPASQIAQAIYESVQADETDYAYLLFKDLIEKAFHEKAQLFIRMIVAGYNRMERPELVTSGQMSTELMNGSTWETATVPSVFPPASEIQELIGWLGSLEGVHVYNVTLLVHLYQMLESFHQKYAESSYPGMMVLNYQVELALKWLDQCILAAQI